MSDIWDEAEEASCYGGLEGKYPCGWDIDCTHLCISPNSGCFKGVRFTLGLLRALQSKAFAEQKWFLEEACKEVEAVLILIIEEERERDD